MSTALARPGTRADLRSGIRGGLNTAVVRTEIRLFRREPGAIFWILLFPTLLLAILGSIPSFRQPDPSFGGLRPIDAYVPVAVLLGLIVGCLQSMPQSLTGYRERGILRRMSTTPYGPPRCCPRRCWCSAARHSSPPCSRSPSAASSST